MIKIYQKNELEDFLLNLDNRQEGADGAIRRSVEEILKSVQKDGDNALFEFTKKFDGVDVSSIGLAVTEQEIADAIQSLPESFLDVLHESADNIRRFHEKGLDASWLSWEDDGIVLGQKVTPLQRVCLYVPGGRAAYPSSLLMTAVPAQVAGVPEICIVTPPTKNGSVNPVILAAASILGITEIYRVGGAQAVAAVAFGTSTIRQADKIVGPGNAYVAEAKRQVFGRIDIDMIAGPSEVTILADGEADPPFTAADLLAQAEHDPLASSILITDDLEFAIAVQKEVHSQAEKLERKEIIQSSLHDWSGILVVDSLEEGIRKVNRIAPEHLGLHVKDPWTVLGKIQNAGAIFLGAWSPESVGDYWAGPNHVLPTNGTARFSSPLSAVDFQKRSSIIQYSKNGLTHNAEAIMEFAMKEGLDGHANAVRQRIR